MKKTFALISAFLIVISCQKENEKNVLFNVNHMNHLTISTKDSKCGEWGGDEKKMVFYRDHFKSQLLADYIEKENDCSHISESKITKSIKRIKIGSEDIDLIIKTVKELSTNKLNKEPIPSHSGIANSIMLSDSTLIINDFPSTDLENFNTLINKITH